MITLVLICTCFAIIATVYYLRKQRSDAKINICALLYVSLTGPLIEESIFRSALKNMFIDNPYGLWINVGLFSLLHSTNYLITSSMYMAFIQMSFAAVVGYVCYYQSTFIESLIVHMVYNFVVYTTSYIIYGYWFYEPRVLSERFYVPKVSRDDYLNNNVEKCISLKSEHIKKDMLNRITLLKKLKKVLPEPATWQKQSSVSVLFYSTTKGTTIC